MATEPDRIGDRISIRSKLGGSGIATTWRAHDTELDQPRCVKVLRPKYGDRRKFMKRFREEVHVLALLNHAHIVRIYQASNDGEQAWVLMELCEAGSLKDHVEAHGPLPPRLACDVVLAAGDGVGHAHEMGVVHGAVKPSNLLLTSSGMVRVTDFGINRIKQADLKHGSMVGQVAFIAPEARSDAGSADARSDIYSLGATLHWAITGKASPDLYSVDPDVDRSLGVPQTVSVFLKKALAFEPRRRQQTVQAFLNELRMIRAGLPADPPDVVPLGSVDASAPRARPTDTEGMTLTPDVAPMRTLVPDSLTVSALLDRLAERPVENLKAGVLEEEGDVEPTDDANRFAGAIAQPVAAPSELHTAPAWETVFPDTWNPLTDLADVPDDPDPEPVAAWPDPQPAVDPWPEPTPRAGRDPGWTLDPATSHTAWQDESTEPEWHEDAPTPRPAEPRQHVPTPPPTPSRRTWTVEPVERSERPSWGEGPPVSPITPVPRAFTPTPLARSTPTPAPEERLAPRGAGGLRYSDPGPPPVPVPLVNVDDDLPEVVAVPTFTPAPARGRDGGPPSRADLLGASKPPPGRSPDPAPPRAPDPDDEPSEITDVVAAESPLMFDRLLMSPWTGAVVLLVSAICMVIAAKFYLDVHVAREVERTISAQPAPSPPPNGAVTPE